MKDPILATMCLIIGISTIHSAFTYVDEHDNTLLYRFFYLIGGIGFIIGAISGFTGWF